MAPQRRNPLYALVAGLAAPGLGLFVVGRAAAGVAVLVLSLAGAILVPLLAIEGTLFSLPDLPHTLQAVVLTFWLPSAALAAGLAWKDGPRQPKHYEHVWWVLGFALCSYAARSFVDRLIVSEYIVQMAFVADTSLSPEVPPGTLVLAVRRGFDPARVQPGDVVAVRFRFDPPDSDDSPRNGPASATADGAKTEERLAFARVIAGPGHKVVVEDGRPVVDGAPVQEAPCTGVLGAGGPCARETLPTGGEAHHTTSSTPARRRLPEVVVGDGQLFVLPDDRSASLSAPAGIVDGKDVIGRGVPTRLRR